MAGRRPTLVLAEEAESRLTILEDLVQAGVSQVISASTPDEALDLFARSNPSHVFVTQGPADADRIKLLSEMATLDPQSTITLVSADSNESFQRKAIKTGVFAVVELREGWAGRILREMAREKDQSL